MDTVNSNAHLNSKERSAAAETKLHHSCMHGMTRQLVSRCFGASLPREKKGRIQEPGAAEKKGFLGRQKKSLVRI